MSHVDRIQSLSQSQRELLSRWLDEREPARPTRAQLTAYCVGEAELPQAELVEFLKARLPEYMIPDSIVYLDALPRLPNGKVDQHALPLPSHEPRTRPTAAIDPRNDAERELLQIWSELLQVENIGVEDNFFELGGDSIITIQMVSRARERGLQLDVAQIGTNPTIASLAKCVTCVEEPAANVFTAEAPLTPIQAWFFDLDLDEPQHWNQSRLFELAEDVDDATLRAAMKECLDHHDGLCARFERTSDGWRQYFTRSDEFELPFVAVSLPSGSGESDLQRHLAEGNRGFDLAVAPLIRMTVLRHSTQRPKVLIAVHHLVIDALSWEILLKDLNYCCRQLLQNAPCQLPPKTAPFGEWANGQAERTQEMQPDADFEDWISQPGEAIAIPVDFQGVGRGNEGSTQHLTVHLEVGPSRDLLANSHEAYRTQPRDLILAALLRAYCSWADRRSLRLGLEGHGREANSRARDVSRTIGWFTAFYPVSLSLPDSDELGQSVKRVKEQLRQVTSRGIEYGVLRYLSPDAQVAQAISSTTDPQLLFNYVGSTVSSELDLFRSVPLLDSTQRHAQNQRSHVLEVNAQFDEQGRFEATWLFSNQLHRRDSVALLAERFTEELQAIVDHCLASDGGNFTPSDFPDVDLSQEELDQFLESLPDE